MSDDSLTDVPESRTNEDDVSLDNGCAPMASFSLIGLSMMSDSFFKDALLRELLVPFELSVSFDDDRSSSIDGFRV